MKDLKGKKVALNKVSNVHYLLVKALESAGLAYADVELAFLPPADARAAFEKGAVDAWVIWDPFQAAAEAATVARTLANGEGLVSNHQFYLSTSAYSQNHPDVLEILIKQIAELDAWANGNTDKVAEEQSASVGIPVDVLKLPCLARPMACSRSALRWWPNSRRLLMCSTVSGSFPSRLSLPTPCGSRRHDEFGQAQRPLVHPDAW